MNLQELKSKEIVVWGTRMYAILLAMYLEDNGIEIAGFCDNNEAVWGKEIYKSKICMSPDSLKAGTLVLMGVKTQETETALAKQLEQMNIKYQKGLQPLIDEYWREVDDRKYLEAAFFFHMGYKMDMDRPKNFNEKLQWLKLNDRDSKYTEIVDKYEVKKYVSEILGEEYVIPTLGVWENFDEIDFDSLPEKFVLKCTHDSGSCIICHNKEEFDYVKAKEKINRCLKRNYFYSSREWPYKDVKPRIIAEEILLTDSNETSPTDYKFFCFDGIPRVVMTVNGGHGREDRISRRMYDMDWNFLKVGLHNKEYEKTVEAKPEKFKQMYELAYRLSKGFKHIRVDFYYINNQIYFGEMTFYHMSGYEVFKPIDWNYEFGNFIKLPFEEEGELL